MCEFLLQFLRSLFFTTCVNVKIKIARKMTDSKNKNVLLCVQEKAKWFIEIRKDIFAAKKEAQYDDYQKFEYGAHKN